MDYDNEGLGEHELFFLFCSPPSHSVQFCVGGTFPMVGSRRLRRLIKFIIVHFCTFISIMGSFSIPTHTYRTRVFSIFTSLSSSYLFPGPVGQLSLDIEESSFDPHGNLRSEGKANEKSDLRLSLIRRVPSPHSGRWRRRNMRGFPQPPLLLLPTPSPTSYSSKRLRKIKI